MAFFNDVTAAAAAGQTVRASMLFYFDFTTGARRFWAGFGDLEAGGETWIGAGQLIEVEGLAAATGTVAAATTFTLSGVDADFVALARNTSDAVKGRRVRVYLQFFTEGWQPLDEPVVIWSGIMDVMQYTAEGPGLRRITLTAELIWTDRNRPPYGLLTSADQKARYPGDKGLDRTASLAQKTIAWPSY